MKTLWIITVLVLIGVGAYFFTRNSTTQIIQTFTPGISATPVPTPTPTASLIYGNGTVIIGITNTSVASDAISDVAITIDKMELHSDAQGWIEIANNPKTYRLPALKSSGQLELAGRATASADIYNQVRLTISKVVVKNKSGASKTAMVPTASFAMATTIPVNGKQFSALKIDILQDASLHTITNGGYLFAPVVTIEARSNATAYDSENNGITVEGGVISSNTKAGMDIDGSVKENFQIDSRAVIKLEGGTLKIEATPTPGN
ncbi:MAG: hypothetical protein A3A33_02220 [Candidatus Yanofskybacteria bacterium RIFCSPLOWO2_01_FULL_49_25]|uniref:DUF4382 domain-containing protein n=1 Tax=Candidatus Yanofskybacteria bacterium RIFCSPLOWO2_01_FULL_49_25 TaxID=1802701 RepID=A0A1F8GRU9_9BACT|nr:MAG: hypothetical protein A3A33_02220 [Candidatus Yanofskybacteria bacterium RIFCSPLOWO2_01_FULL_49_25]